MIRGWGFTVTPDQITRLAAQDVAQRGHPQLVALEQAQQPEPRGVGEGLQAADEGGDLGGAGGEDDGNSHQLIRMKG